MSDFETYFDEVWIDGVLMRVWLAVVPEDAPADVREAIARVNLVRLRFRCPCGVEQRWTDDDLVRIGRGETMPFTEHGSDCVADRERFLAAFKRWQAA